MKLLYITNGITGVGGLERVLSIKTDLLISKYGYEIEILTLNELGKKPFYKFNDSIEFHSIKVAGNPIKYLFSFFSKIKKKVRDIKPNILVVCDDGLKAFFIPLIFRQIPIVYERHVSIQINRNSGNFYQKCISYMQLNLMQKLSKRFAAFVVLNKGNKDEWNQNDKIKIIPNPISFNPAKSPNYRNKRAIAVGKQGYQKNYEEMLNIWKNIDKEWELHIYGKKDLNAGLDNLRTKLNLNNVFLHEPVKNIMDKYIESSLYLMTSRYEGLPMVLLEAMSCGLPCISYDCPHGPRELIKDGENGYLVENRNREMFTEKINNLINNVALRSQMGENAKALIQKYSPETILKEWDDLFKSLKNTKK